MKSTPRILTRSIAALLAAGALHHQAQAVNGDWITTAGGAWGTATNWSSNPTVPGSAAGDIININSNIAAAAAITLDANRTVGTLLIGDSDTTHAFSLTGNTLILDQTAVAPALVRFGVVGSTGAIANVIGSAIQLNDNARFYTTLTTPQQLTGVISGAFSMTFDNDDGITPAGPVSLQGQFLVNAAAANTYSLGTTIDDVRVTIQGNNAALGTGAVTILDGGQVYNATGLTAIANTFNINGNGWLESAGQLGALRLESGAIVTGAVNMQSNSAIGSNSGTGTVNGVISGTGFTLTKVGVGVLALGGVNTYSGGTTIGNGAVQANNNSAFGSGAVNIVAGGATNHTKILVNGGVTIGNTINIGPHFGVAGNGSVQHAGAGLATVNGPINITGSPSAGGLFVGGNSAANVLVLNGPITSSVTVSQREGFVRYGGGGTGYTSLSVTNTAQVGATNGISTAANVILGGSGTATLDMNGFDQSLAGLTFGTATSSNQGNVSLGARTLTLTADVTVVSNAAQNVSHSINAGAGGALNVGTVARTIDVTDNLAADDLAINAAAINGTGGIIKAGAGTLALNGVTIGGALTVNAGAVQAGRFTTAGSFTTGALTFGPGATAVKMKIGTGGDVINGGAVTTSGGTTTFNLSQFGGMLAPSATPYPLINFTGASPGLAGFAVVLPGHAVGTLNDTTTPGVLGLVVTANDRVIWDGTNTTAWATGVTGNWKLQTGLAQTDYIESDDVIFPDTPVNNNVVIAANVSPSNVSFTNTAATTYNVSGGAGIIGATGLTKTGNGTVVLANPNGYAGATTVSAGTLELDHDAAGNVVLSGTSGVNVAGGATLKLSRDDGNITFNRSISGAGTVLIDPHTAAGAAVRDVAITGTNTGFSGLWRLSPSNVGAAGLGSFRTNAPMTPTTLGSGAVQVDNGGQLWVAGNTFPNTITITGTGYAEAAGGTPVAGTGFTYGGLGAIRLENNAVLSGNITLNGNAKIQAFNATATLSGSIGVTNPADLFVIGGGTNGTTILLTGTNNAGASPLNNIWINSGGTVGSQRLNIGNGGTSGTLGAGSVTLNGSAASNAVLGFDRSDSYALAPGQNLTAVGTFTTTFIDFDTRGAGFSDNGNTISLGTPASGGSLRAGITRSDTVTSFSGNVSAGSLTIGALNTAVPTRNATVNLLSGAAMNVANITMAGGGNTAPLGNTNGALLNIASGTTLTATGNLFLGDQNSSAATINQAGGAVSVGGQVRIGHWPNEASSYNISGGTLTTTGARTQFPYQATGTQETGGGIYLGIDGAGFLTQASGTITTGFIVLDNRGESNAGGLVPNGIDTFTQNGGTLVLTLADGIISRFASTAVNLNGGTIRAATGISPALDTNRITVQSGGVTLDTNGANTFTLYGPLAGTGTVSLTNTGAGNGVLSIVDGGAGANNTAGGTMPGGSLGSAGANIANNGTLQVNRTGSQVWTGALSGAGTLTKLGAGAVGLLGSGSGFTGTVNANGGRLDVPANLGATTFNLGDGATLSGEPTLAANIAIGVATGGTVLFDPTTAGALTGTAITVNGANNVDFVASPTGAGPWTALNYTTKAGAGTFALANAGAYRNLPVVTDTGSAITVNVTGTKTETWTGSVSAIWDSGLTANTNWNDGVGVDNFFAGDSVVFPEGGANPAVTVTSGVSPWKTSVTSATTAYTLTSTINGISGPGNLEKSGASTLTLVGPNTYNGKTVITGGAVSIAAPTSLGSALSTNTIELSNGGRLNATAAMNLGETRSIAVGTGGGVISMTNAAAQTVTVAGNLSGTGDLTFTSGGAGAPTFSLNGLGTGYSGNVTVNSAGGGATTLILPHNNALVAGTLTLQNPTTGATGATTVLNLPNGTTLNSAVTLVLNSLTSGANSYRTTVSSSGGAAINGPIQLNGDNIIQVTTANFLTINGNVSAGGGGFTGTFFPRGAGTTIINGALNIPNGILAVTDGGTAIVNSAGANAMAAANPSFGTLRIGANDALGTTAAMTIGQNDANNATFDLNGFDQTIGTLTHTAGTGGTKSVTNTNTTTTSTFTVNQAIARNFAGPINGRINLVKGGAADLTLSNINSTFNGSLTLNTGTLIASGVSGGTNGTLGVVNVAGRTMTVNSGATLSFASNNIFGNGVGNANLPALTLDGGTLTSTRYNVLGPVTLNGGTLTQSTSDTGNFEGFQFRGDVTVGGSAASTISTGNSRANHLNANTTFNVANATGDAAADLLVSAPLRNQSNDFAQAIGGLTKTGTGTLELSATSTYTGATNVNNGTLLVGGNISGSTVNVNGGTLGGGGTTGPINVTTGTIAPGTSIGTLTTGSVSLSGGATFGLEINSTALTTDLLTTSGSVSLSLAILSATDLGSATLSAGETFNFINAAGGVTGTFAGLPDGAVLLVGASQYAIDYTATGVSLVAVPEPGSLAALLGGMGLLTGLRRFRRR